MSKRNKVLTFSGIAVGIAALIIVNVSSGRDKGMEVRFEGVSRRNLVATVTASGRITPKRKVDVSADITGRITRIPVKEGEIVRKGDLLLSINGKDFEDVKGYSAIFFKLKPGDQIALDYERNGKKSSLKATISSKNRSDE